MRKVVPAFIAVLVASIVVGAWAMTRSTAESQAAPIAAPAPMNTLDMMMNRTTLPVHEIVDAI